MELAPFLFLSMLMLLYACFSFKNNKFSQKIIDSKKDVIDTKILVVKNVINVMSNYQVRRRF